MNRGVKREEGEVSKPGLTTEKTKIKAKKEVKTTLRGRRRGRRPFRLIDD